MEQKKEEIITLLSQIQDAKKLELIKRFIERIVK